MLKKQLNGCDELSAIIIEDTVSFQLVGTDDLFVLPGGRKVVHKKYSVYFLSGK